MKAAGTQRAARGCAARTTARQAPELIGVVLGAQSDSRRPVTIEDRDNRLRGGKMVTRTRCLVTVATCVAALCLSLGSSGGGAAAATKVPNVNGIWLAYAWATGQGKPSSPNQAFVLRDKPGSTRFTGDLGEFKIVGTIASTGKALLVIGLQPGTTQTTNDTVKFAVSSSRTAPLSRTIPPSPGSFDYVRRATGQPVPHSTGSSHGHPVLFSDKPQSHGPVRFGLKPGAQPSSLSPQDDSDVSRNPQSRRAATRRAATTMSIAH